MTTKIANAKTTTKLATFAASLGTNRRATAASPSGEMPQTATTSNKINHTTSEISKHQKIVRPVHARRLARSRDDLLPHEPKIRKRGTNITASTASTAQPIRLVRSDHLGSTPHLRIIHATITPDAVPGGDGNTGCHALQVPRAR